MEQMISQKNIEMHIREKPYQAHSHKQEPKENQNEKGTCLSQHAT